MKVPEGGVGKERTGSEVVEKTAGASGPGTTRGQASWVAREEESYPQQFMATRLY